MGTVGSSGLEIYVSNRTTCPIIDVTYVVFVAHEAMILSFLTAPVFGSTLSTPKNFCLAATKLAGAAAVATDAQTHIAAASAASFKLLCFIGFPPLGELGSSR